MPEWLSRTELLLGKEKVGEIAAGSCFGRRFRRGGSYAAEQLCRAG